MTTPPRVMLDTNVVLSALLFGVGTTGRLRLAWQQSAFVPLASNATVQELVRALAYPKCQLSAREQEELLANDLPCTQVVRIPSPAPVVPQCRDPLDMPLMHLAVAGTHKGRGCSKPHSTAGGCTPPDAISTAVAAVHVAATQKRLEDRPTVRKRTDQSTAAPENRPVSKANRSTVRVA